MARSRTPQFYALANVGKHGEILVTELILCCTLTMWRSDEEEMYISWHQNWKNWQNVQLRQILLDHPLIQKCSIQLENLVTVAFCQQP